MRGVLTEVPDSLLAERARLGLDVFDEMWDGELHMPPAPGSEHQIIGMGLAHVLLPPARRRGLVAMAQAGVYRTDRDYRIPDLVYARPGVITARGVEGPPALVIEVRSPGDETYEKLGFYAAAGLPELLVVHRDTKAVELFVLDDGQLLPADPDGDGWLRSVSLAVCFRSADGKVEVDVAGTRTLVP